MYCTNQSSQLYEEVKAWLLELCMICDEDLASLKQGVKTLVVAIEVFLFSIVIKIKFMNYYYLRYGFSLIIMSMMIMFSFAQTQHLVWSNLFPGSAAWKTGVALYSFNRFSFADAIEKADSAGVKYVEGFSFHKLGKEFNDQTMATVSKEGRSKMKRFMDKKGITMPSMYVAGAQNEVEWKSFFNIAKEFGMKYLVCEPQKDHWDMVDSLAGLYNIKIAIHQHSKESGSIYWHPDSVLAALKDHPNMGVCADLGHWARSGLDPVKCLENLEGHILSIHLKDIDEFNNRANDVTVGTGVINFPGVVTELKRQNFDGMIYVECEHKMDNNLSDVVQAIRYFDGLASL